MEGPRQEKIKHDGREYLLNARWMTWRKVWNNWGRGTAQLGRLGWCPWEQRAGPAADLQTAHLAQRRLKRRLSPLALRLVVVSRGSGERLLPVQIPGLCWRFWLGSQEMNFLQQPRYSHLRNDDKLGLSHLLWLISQILRKGLQFQKHPRASASFSPVSWASWSGPTDVLSLLLLKKPCYLSRCHWPEPTTAASLGPNTRAYNNMDFLRGRGAIALEQAAKKLGNASQSSASSNKWQLTNPPLSLSSCFP